MAFFIDEARILVIAGKGGNGIISFRREKFVPKGGPDGGNGGNGGDVILIANRSYNTLSSARMHYKYVAEDGEKGGSRNKTGATGKNLLIEVPIGTVVKDEETGEIVCDLCEDKQELIVARGGRGGAGNSVFKSSINQAPRKALPGKEGQVKKLLLELKVMADVGLVGFPNAGKSTLISNVSNAEPEIAPYPFTTLTPHLGVVNITDWQYFVMADIPGIIEGAHEGKGLGIRFLKHIERTKALLYVIDIFDENPAETFKILKKELKSFNAGLLEKDFMVVINKIDSFPEDQLEEVKKEFLKKTRIAKGKLLFISGLKKIGLEELKTTLYHLLSN